MKETINIKMGGGGGGGIECPEVLELILQLQINANNWQFSQLNIEPCTVPYTVLTMFLL